MRILITLTEATVVSIESEKEILLMQKRFYQPRKHTNDISRTAHKKVKKKNEQTTSNNEANDCGKDEDNWTRNAAV